MYDAVEIVHFCQLNAQCMRSAYQCYLR